MYGWRFKSLFTIKQNRSGRKYTSTISSPPHPHFPHIKMIVHCKRLCLTDIIKVLIDSETFNQETIIVSLFDLFKGPFVYRLKELWGEGRSAILSNK